jgi:hypothetical protein
MISHTGASPKSLAKIRAAIERTKDAFGAGTDFDWESPFYQYANRLAHLYFLRELNGLDAYLLFVYFADAPDVPPAERCTVEQWEGASRLVEKALGLGSHRYRAHVKSLIVPQLLCTSMVLRAETLFAFLFPTIRGYEVGWNTPTIRPDVSSSD